MFEKPALPLLLGGAAAVGLVLFMTKKAHAAAPAADALPALPANLDEAMVSVIAPNTPWLPATTLMRVSSANMVLQPDAGGVYDLTQIGRLPIHVTKQDATGTYFYIDANDTLLPVGDPKSVDAVMAPIVQYPGALLFYKPSRARYTGAFVTDPTTATALAKGGPWALNKVQPQPAPAPQPVKTAGYYGRR
jgi:hypothetical protein